jgi:SAM-dependent methyltransferase
MIPVKPEIAWYESWFDTSWYHILYKHRDFNEAELFIDNVCQYLALPSESVVLDLACGKGRHAFYLARKGFEVTGLDLSARSIAEASQSAHARLQFHIHDMREVYKADHFDVVFNLFTSFGYFEDKADDEAVLQSIAAGLKSRGLFVFDYLHVTHVLETHIASEKQVHEGITFSISRHLSESWIVKQIAFVAEEQSYCFYEKVRNYSPEELATMLQRCGFTIIRSFGNYRLDPLTAESPRCIYIARRL